MPTAMTAYAVARHENGFGHVHPLQRGIRCTVGRAPTNKIVLADDLCSREHAEIYFAEGKWRLRDLGSLNGSKVNEIRIHGEEILEPNDELQLGRSKFLFVENLRDLPGVPQSSMEENLEIRKRLRTTRYGATKNEDGDRQREGETILEVHRWEKAIGVLYRLGLDMGSAETLEELVECVLDGLLEGIPAEVGAVLGLKEGRASELLAHRHRDPKIQTYHKVSQFVSAEVLSSKEAILAENVHSDPALRNRESLSELKVGSLICAGRLRDERARAHPPLLDHLETITRFGGS